MELFDSKLFKRTVFGLLFLLVAIYVYSFFYRSINGDEAIIAEHAYWFNKIGIVKSQMFDGMGMGWENRQFHYHKLFVLLGAFIVHFLGISLYGLRVISLISVLVCFYFLSLYLNDKKNGSQKYPLLVCITVLLANTVFFEYSLLYRPEVLVMSLGFMSFYFLNKGIRTSKYRYLFFAGLFAGLSAFSHLNGLCYVLTGFLLLASLKQYKEAVFFGIVSAAFSLLYFFDIHSIGEFKSFWIQFTNDPNLGKEGFSLFTPLIRLYTEQKRFFWDPYIASFSILFLLTLFFFYKQLKHTYPNLLRYVAICFIVFAFISHGPTVKYIIIYFPFMALLISAGIMRITELPKTRRLIYTSILFVFVASNLFFSITKLVRVYDSVEVNNRICSYLPRKNVNVFANETFFFNGITNYTIHIPMAFELLHENYLQTKPTEEDYFRFARERKNTYLIIKKHVDTPRILKFVHFDRLQEGQILFNYRVIRKEKDFAILVLND